MKDWFITEIVEQLEGSVESKIIFELNLIPKDDDSSVNEFILKVNREGAINFAHDILDSVLRDGYDYELLSKYVDSNENPKYIIKNIEFINTDTNSEVEVVSKQTFKEKIKEYVHAFNFFSIVIGILVCLLWGVISILIAIFKLLF